MFKELIKYRDLLYMLTLRDIKIRYKQSVMGFLWAIFMPIVAILAGILIKTAFAFVAHQPFDLKGVASISVKVLPWTFFISAIKFSVQSLVGNSELVTKIYFPREVLPFASISACLFDLFVAAITLAIILSFAQIGISIYILWLPLLLIFLVLFTAGLGLILSSANLFFRDIKYIVEVILMFGIFFTPVFYDVNTFGRLKSILLLNPIGSILEGINNIIILHKMPDIAWISYAGISSIIIFIFGSIIFSKLQPFFAENI